jgi:hypothetical protein
MDWKMYFYPEHVTVLMNRKMLIFSVLGGIYYCVQFLACCSAVNLYSDASRLDYCLSDLNNTNAPPIKGEQASAIMDPTILALGIYHIIEWVRCTILLTVVCLGVNLMQAWYILSINSIYGLIAFIYCHVVYFGDAAKGCEPKQTTRY